MTVFTVTAGENQEQTTESSENKTERGSGSGKGTGSPKTGDDSPLLLWILLMAGSLMAILGILVVRHKKNKED